MTNFWKAVEQFDFGQTVLEAEYRLYYDAAGNPLYYTMESPDGDYVVVDQDTYTEGRYDVKVVDGRVCVPLTDGVAKLKPVGDNIGVFCHPRNVAITTSNAVNSQCWQLSLPTKYVQKYNGDCVDQLS